MRILVFVFALFLSIGTSLSAQPPAPPQPKPATPAAVPTSPDKVVLTIGDEKMTAAHFEELIAGLPPQYRAAARGAAKRQLVDQLVGMKILVQEARRRKLDQNPAFKAQL